MTFFHELETWQGAVRRKGEGEIETPTQGEGRSNLPHLVHLYVQIDLKKTQLPGNPKPKRPCGQGKHKGAKGVNP